MGDLSKLFSGENAALVGGIIAVLSTLRATFPKVFAKGLVKRLLPVFPVVLGVVAMLLGFGTAVDAETTWQNRMLLGCVTGFTAGQLFVTGKRSVFGFGLTDKKESK